MWVRHQAFYSNPWGHACRASPCLLAPVAVTLGRLILYVPPQSPLGHKLGGWAPGTGDRCRELRWTFLHLLTDIPFFNVRWNGRGIWIWAEVCSRDANGRHSILQMSTFLGTESQTVRAGVISDTTPPSPAAGRRSLDVLKATECVPGIAARTTVFWPLVKINAVYTQIDYVHCSCLSAS